MKKKLILVGAPPACGKNFVSDLICKKLERVAYFDKDDLTDLRLCAFNVSGQTPNTDGEFYVKNIRPFEYSTLFNLAFSALKYENYVLVNAPFIQESKNEGYMADLKKRAEKLNAQLIFIWVTASEKVCFERMQKRNSDRDIGKLKNWQEYVKTVDYTVPNFLEEKGLVDKVIHFDNENESKAKLSLDKTIKILGE